MHDKPVKVYYILGAMALGALLGAAVGSQGTLFGFDVIRLCDFLGTLFLNLLKMLIVPLVMASVITGVAGMGGTRNLGRLGGVSVLFYVLTTLIAVLIALLVLNVVQPGLVNGQPARELLALHADASTVDISVRAKANGGLLELFLGMVPTNIVEAASGTKLLGLIFFSVLFGLFLTQVESPYREAVGDFWQGLFRVMMRMTGFVMRLAPLGVSINHAGSALYECAAALFIAQAYGLHLSLITQFTIVVLALVTSMGIAGIPAASLVGITVILAAVGLPAEAIGVLLVLDRLLDMARTAVNVLADATCAVIVARLSGETGVLSGQPAAGSPGKLMPT